MNEIPPFGRNTGQDESTATPCIEIAVTVMLMIYSSHKLLSDELRNQSRFRRIGNQQLWFVTVMSHGSRILFQQILISSSGHAQHFMEQRCEPAYENVLE